MTIFEDIGRAQDRTVKEYEEKIDAIMEYAANHPTLGTSFVESVSAQITDKDFISEAQMRAIDNILESFDIEY